LPKASSLAATIKRELGIEPEVTRGDRGVFDVTVDGKLLFSKHSAGRFPDDDEIVRNLRAQ
jgi:selT/selW/selH-like putative selenoprotein